MPTSLEQFQQAVNSGDAAALKTLLDRNPELQTKINDPIFGFDCPAVVAVSNRNDRSVLKVLLDAGADVNTRSTWWAGSFGVLDQASPENAAYLIERGAVVDAHSAARLGMLEKLKQLVTADPALVHARGGDGKMPLHFASSIPIAEYLLDQGAPIDALDIDHESTPAQYLIQEHPEVARYLVDRGAKTDILMSAALGDVDRVRRFLDSDPALIGIRINDTWFPKQDPRSGGTIYFWTLGGNRSAHQVAARFNQKPVFDLLMERSPAGVRLLNACWLGDEMLVRSLQSHRPSEMDASDVSAAAEANNTDAVRLLLESGWPADSGSGASPLHWAAWHGNPAMVQSILSHNPPLEKANHATFHGTPLGWAIHGSQNGWYAKSGDYGAVVTALLAAGAKPPAVIAGSAAVREALKNSVQ